jgi:hypothetical protein
MTHEQEASYPKRPPLHPTSPLPIAVTMSLKTFICSRGEDTLRIAMRSPCHQGLAAILVSYLTYGPAGYALPIFSASTDRCSTGLVLGDLEPLLCTYTRKCHGATHFSGVHRGLGGAALAIMRCPQPVGRPEVWVQVPDVKHEKPWQRIMTWQCWLRLSPKGEETFPSPTPESKVYPEISASIRTDDITS